MRNENVNLDGILCTLLYEIHEFRSLKKIYALWFNSLYNFFDKKSVNIFLDKNT